LIKSGAVDYIQPELAKMGGLTCARKVAVSGELFNYTLCPHCYTIGPAFYTALQLDFTLSNTDWHELKWIPSGLQTEVVSPVQVTNGHVSLPDSPGLGFTTGAIFQ
jgi:L-alanine-DL-glutamate epimerase-like enolase superfamily enzyme